MALTAHQSEIMEGVKGALRRGDKRIIIKGSAGVGKTYLMSELAKDCSKDYTINTNYNNGLVFLTAPTNKAVSVLQGKVEANSRMNFKTIHSACEIKMITDARTGQRYFKPVWSKDKGKDFRQCRVAVIDECSMLNTEFVGGTVYNEKTGEPVDEVEGHLEKFNFPIIFLGDDKQLNPVGEPKGSPIFNKGYTTFELTEIIRQGAGNPIIDLSRDLDMIFFKLPKLIEGKGYVYDDNKVGLIDDLAEVNGTDELKYLAYHVDEVGGMNQLVRETRYGTPEKIEKEETIVFNTPHESFYTNQEVKVIDKDIVIDWVYIPAHNCRFDGMDQPVGPFNKIKMKFYRANDNFNVVHEESEYMYRTIIKDLIYNCTKNGWNWKGRWWFEQQFADITYNHALTVHKSQGSTYKHAILNIGDINQNRNASEKRRLLYTGVTRASDLVILNNVK